MTGIKSDGVRFAYRKKQILEDVTFEAGAGRITYLAGNNGAGKTTWIKLALNLLRGISGSITFDGKTFEEVRERIGVAFDTPPMYPNLSVRDNLYVLYGIDRKSDAVYELLGQLGITDHMIASKAGKLSFGQKHRVEIAGVLLQRPDFLFLDEPDLGVDPSSWEFIRQEIVNTAKNGGTVIITGQNFALLEEFVDDVAVLMHGKIVCSQTKEAFINQWNGKDAHDLRGAFDNLQRKWGTNHG